MSSRSTFECFGLVINGITADEAMKRIDDALLHGAQTMVVTANPEILLEARKDPAYWNVLRSADMRLVDSFGLKLAGLLVGANPTRVTGVDFAERLIQVCMQRDWKVAVVGGEEGNADKASWKLRQAYPELSIFAERGGIIQNDGTDDEATAEMRFRLTQYAPDILLVGFGAPKQETWIAKHLQDFPSVKVAIGVGGTIDYWSETKKRAPKVFRDFGLEWLYRIIHEPSRWKRILNATLVFPIIFLVDRTGARRKTHT
ncbi:MAG: WecB/TagA/CpsF family glycosyltransferase [Patescibacteria group bacterium]